MVLLFVWAAIPPVVVAVDVFEVSSNRQCPTDLTNDQCREHAIDNGNSSIFLWSDLISYPPGCSRREDTTGWFWQWNSESGSTLTCDASGVAHCECKSTIDEYDCAFMPDVTNLAGTLDNQCNTWCDVWGFGSNDYDELTAMNFLNGEPIVFVSDTADLSSACNSYNATFGWAGSGGWAVHKVTANTAPQSVFAIDSLHYNRGSAYMELRDSTVSGLAEIAANCDISYSNPRICRAGTKTILQLGNDVGLDCPLVGPIADSQGTGTCNDTSTYTTLAKAAVALAANRNSGDASCHTITFIGDPARTNIWFRLHASDTTSPKSANGHPRTAYVVTCSPPPSLPPPPSQPPPLPPPSLPPVQPLQIQTEYFCSRGTITAAECKLRSGVATYSVDEFPARPAGCYIFVNAFGQQAYYYNHLNTTVPCSGTNQCLCRSTELHALSDLAFQTTLTLPFNTRTRIYHKHTDDGGFLVAGDEVRYVPLTTLVDASGACPQWSSYSASSPDTAGQAFGGILQGTGNNIYVDVNLPDIDGSNTAEEREFCFLKNSRRRKLQVIGGPQVGSVARGGGVLVVTAFSPPVRSHTHTTRTRNLQSIDL